VIVLKSGSVFGVREGAAADAGRFSGEDIEHESAMAATFGGESPKRKADLRTRLDRCLTPRRQRKLPLRPWRPWREASIVFPRPRVAANDAGIHAASSPPRRAGARRDAAGAGAPSPRPPKFPTAPQ